jgi:hypothetical protein
MSAIEKQISFLVENQFPHLFKEDGQNLVQFLTHYFKWMETNQEIAYINVASVSVSVSNNIISGNNTTLTEYFANGDSIAIFRSDNSYDIFEIDTVDSDTQITLTDVCTFTNVATTVANTYNYYNALYHLRHTDVYRNIDETPEAMIPKFKETFLKNIQFEIASNKRLLIKKSLDLYRSKGSERAVDLLFRLVYGTGAQVYSPSRDIFRTSSGKWVRPRYLELVPKDFNHQLVGKQIVGQTSGSTAYVEEVVRRTVNGVIIDVAYIFSDCYCEWAWEQRGNFVAGELIDTIDNDLLRDGNRAYLLGSLNEIVIDVNGSGSGLVIGDIVDIKSQNGVGREAKGRIANTIGITGLTDFTFIDGGYGYTNNTQVIISERVVEVDDVDINLSSEQYNFYNMFEVVEQRKADITFYDANNVIAVGDELFTYYANGDVAGQGIVVVANYSSNAGNVSVIETVNSLRPVAEHNANQTGNVNYVANTNVVRGWAPNQNLTGNVFISTRSTNVVGDGTTFDTELVTPTANLAGSMNIQSGNVIIFTSTVSLSGFRDGDYITAHVNSSTFETRKIVDVINATHLELYQGFSFTNTAANVAIALPQTQIAAYINSTVFELKTINTIVNAYYITIDSFFQRTNVETKISNASPTGTEFIEIGANQTGTVAAILGSRVLEGTGTDFEEEFNAGDWIIIFDDAAHQFNRVQNVIDSNSMILLYPMEFNNATSDIAISEENPEVVYGKILTFHSNSTYDETHFVNLVVNNSYLTIQTPFEVSNLSTRYANSDIDYSIYTTANDVIATMNVYTNETATANALGIKETVRISVNSTTSSILNIGDVISQYHGANLIGYATINTVSQFTNSALLTVINVRGKFKKGLNVVTNSFSANVTNINLFLGLNQINGTFTALENNVLRARTGNTVGSIAAIGSGSGAAFELSDDLLNVEYFDVNHDYLKDFIHVGLSDESYGFNNVDVNATAGVIADALEIVNTEFGTLSGFVSENPGTNYTIAPVVLVYEPISYAMGERGETLMYLSNVVGDFITSEIVNQSPLGRASVKEFSLIQDLGSIPEAAGGATHFMRVSRYRLFDQDYLKKTTNSSTKLVGFETGATANVEFIVDYDLSEFIGLNANIDSSVVATNGAATVIEVVDSGFGFKNNETIIFTKGSITDGFLSNTKKIFDGYYYQQYSYDILSSISRDKYEDIVNLITHVAGTKMFSTFVTTTIAPLGVNSSASITEE